MRDARLVQLFERYRSKGDAEALAKVFDEVAPALLKVARHIDGRTGEAEDLVQTTFLVAIERASVYDATRPLVPWLMGILINQSRLARRRRGRTDESAVEDKRADSDLGVDLEHRELATAVVAALHELPDVYREVLMPHLTQGMKPGEIADLLGRPHGTVRAQIHRGIRMIRRILPAGFALGAAATMTAREGLATVREEVLDAARERAKNRMGGPHGSGHVTVTTTRSVLQKSVLASIALVAGIAGWWFARGERAAEPTKVAAVGPRAAFARDRVAATEDATEARRASTATAEPGAKPAEVLPYGQIEVHVTTARDHAPAAGRHVTVLAWGEEQWYARVSDAITGADGSALIERVHAGRVGIHVDHGRQERVTVEPGERLDVEFELPRGIDVLGRVVDRHGAPIAGALVETWERRDDGENASLDDARRAEDSARAIRERAPSSVANSQSSGANSPGSGELSSARRRQCTTRADGTFALSDLDRNQFLFVHASGHTASDLYWLDAPRYRATDQVRLEIVLSESGAELTGRVLDPRGSPVADARVVLVRDETRIGEADDESVDVYRANSAHAARVRPRCFADGSVRIDGAPVAALTDALGRFTTDPVVPGPFTVRVEAEGFAPWSALVVVGEEDLGGSEENASAAVTGGGTGAMNAGAPSLEAVTVGNVNAHAGSGASSGHAAGAATAPMTQAGTTGLESSDAASATSREASGARTRADVDRSVESAEPRTGAPAPSRRGAADEDRSRPTSTRSYTSIGDERVPSAADDANRRRTVSFPNNAPHREWREPGARTSVAESGTRSEASAEEATRRGSETGTDRASETDAARSTGDRSDRGTDAAADSGSGAPAAQSAGQSAVLDGDSPSGGQSAHHATSPGQHAHGSSGAGAASVATDPTDPTDPTNNGPQRRAAAVLAGDLLVHLTSGVTIRGVLRMRDGSPAEGAVVSVCSPGDLAPRTTHADARGEYEIRHASPGVIALSASAHGLGEPARARFATNEAERLEWNAVLEPEKVIRGVVKGPDDRPVATWLVKAVPEARAGEEEAVTFDRWIEQKMFSDPAMEVLQCWTERGGEFTVPCRGNTPHRLELRPRARWANPPHATLRGVRPGASEVLMRYAPSGSSVHGKLALPAELDGQPCELIAIQTRVGNDSRASSDPVTGEFEIGPLPEGSYEIIAWPAGRFPHSLGHHELSRGARLELGILRIE